MLVRLLLLTIALLATGCRSESPQIQAESPVASAHASISAHTTSAIEDAYTRKLSDVWLEGEGEVVKLLADDHKGARHQKFLVKVSNDKTLLFAHNIDLAPRIEGLKVGDNIRFKGEYVYNPKGGVMHWTHHDPQAKIEGGWIKHNGQTYQ